MKIAIIGGGISGMAAAYLLNPQHDITVYERESDIGGHSRTLNIDLPEKNIAVDSGFIVFNHRNYPQLTALFDHLAVPTTKSNMSFGVSIDNGWLEYGTKKASGLIAQKRNLLRPEFIRMLVDILRFNKRAEAYAAKNPAASMQQCLSELGLGEWFVRYYLLAMGGAIWSTPLRQMLEFPAATLIRFFANHGLLTINDQPQWYTIVGGSREYVRRLTAPYRHNIRLHCGATRISRHDEGVSVSDDGGTTIKYQQAILACHSDQALRLLDNPSEPEQAILGSIRYQANRVVLHSDVRFMPRRKRAWASWVYRCDNRRHQQPAVSLSYWMNHLQPLGTDYPVIATLNPSVTPQLLHDEHTFEHPVFDQAAIQAQERMAAIQGRDRLWFCGAWQGYGFHEDGLASAVTVARQLGAAIPWQK